MKLIYQNDTRLYPVIRSIGCFVRSCGGIAELKTGRALTAGQINELWDWAKASGNVNRENNVRRSAPIATKALRMLGDKGSFVEVATFQNGRTSYYASVSPEMRARPKSYIQKIKTGGTEGTHFRVVGYDGEVLFDPYNPPPKALSIFYSIIYAYVGGKDAGEDNQ